jgi:hypothetical protein
MLEAAEKKKRLTTARGGVALTARSMLLASTKSRGKWQSTLSRSKSMASLSSMAPARLSDGIRMADFAFDYATFAALASTDLHSYLEPMLADAGFSPDVPTACRILGELRSYDKYHLVYGLLLCSRAIPERLLLVLPDYLGHEEPAVWATALNILNDVDRRYLTWSVLNHVRNMRDAFPERTWLTDLVSHLDRQRS